MVEYIVGFESVFVSMMNVYVVNLGMIVSYFVNSYGLYDVDYYMFLCDMVILFCVLIEEILDMYVIYSEKEFIYNGIK